MTRETTIGAARTRWWIPAALLGVFVLQCAWFVRTQAITYDEPVHILAGMKMWQENRFDFVNDQPSLPRLLMAMPAMHAKLDGAWRPHFAYFKIDQAEPSLESITWRARVMTVLLGVLMGIAIWFATRKMFSEGAANVSLALFAFSPSMIGNFSVATTDGIGALSVFVGAFQLVRWRRSQTPGQTVLLGAAIGFMLLAKHYTAPLVLVLTTIALVAKADGAAWNPRRWNWKLVLAAWVVAVLVLWSGYFFHTCTVHISNGEMWFLFKDHPGFEVDPVPWPKDLSFLLPAGEYLEALSRVFDSNAKGRASYLLGEVSHTGGWHSYYPVAMALKWPTILLVMVLGGIAAVATRRRELWKNDLWIFAAFPALFLAMAMLAQINIGERHILPVLPFALLFAGAVWEVAKKKRVAVIALGILLAMNAVDVMRYAPNYLSYFNAFVRPAESWRMLSDSNVDWGQGLLALREYQAEHPEEPLYVAAFTSVDPALYGLHYTPLEEGQRVRGTVVISATHLSGMLLKDPDAYKWVLPYPRKAVLDHTLYVFDTR